MWTQSAPLRWPYGDLFSAFFSTATGLDFIGSKALSTASMICNLLGSPTAINSFVSLWKLMAGSWFSPNILAPVLMAVVILAGLANTVTRWPVGSLLGRLAFELVLNLVLMILVRPAVRWVVPQEPNEIVALG